MSAPPWTWPHRCRNSPRILRALRPERLTRPAPCLGRRNSPRILRALRPARVRNHYRQQRAAETALGFFVHCDQFSIFADPYFYLAETALGFFVHCDSLAAQPMCHHYDPAGLARGASRIELVTSQRACNFIVKSLILQARERLPEDRRHLGARSSAKYQGSSPGRYTLRIAPIPAVWVRAYHLRGIFPAGKRAWLLAPCACR
jgi:hypothetical protein